MINSYIPILTLAIVYLVLSLNLSHYIYITSKTIIDEIFHLPQGLAYCYGEYDRWDPKITTLPGLYLYSSAICGIFGKCSVYCLRVCSIIASCANLMLIYLIRKYLHPKENTYQWLFNAVNIALLPPLFFFSQFYYTDVLSLTTVLGLLFFGLHGYFFAASLCGMAAVLTRQTNILYILFIIGLRGLGLVYNNIFHINRFYVNSIVITHKDLIAFARHPKAFLLRASNGISILNATVPMEIISYNTVVLFFMIFALFNGGIVVGDKEAHPATIHFTQILYFSLFSVFFGWMHYLQHIIPFIKTFFNHLFPCMLGIVIISMLIQFNTIIHPYLLADNRHYVFYVWNRFFHSNTLRLMWAPIYFFSLFIIMKKSYNRADIRFSFVYPVIILLGLCLQGLIEVRYFFTPYVILRLHYRDISYKILLLEFIFFIAINYATFNIFFTKEIRWNDFKDIQRLIW